MWTVCTVDSESRYSVSRESVCLGICKYIFFIIISDSLRLDSQVGLVNCK